MIDIGRYRTFSEPMQVVSGPLHRPLVHFEAPPSQQVMQEMDGFMKWFQDTAPDGRNPLRALTRAGIAHLYFVCIHPLEDGNGRIGRAIAEKALAQSFGQPTLIALSHTIQKHKMPIMMRWSITIKASRLQIGWCISPRQSCKRNFVRKI